MMLYSYSYFRVILFRVILKKSQVKGLRDPKCGCTFESFGFIKAVRNEIVTLASKVTKFLGEME